MAPAKIAMLAMRLEYTPNMKARMITAIDVDLCAREVTEQNQAIAEALISAVKSEGYEARLSL